MAVAGWYNDEIDPTLARWHDGAGWTEHVVDKAAWEAYGEPPPPPEDLEPVGTGRLRPLIGSAVVVALLAIGGLALANDGDDGDSPERAPTADTSGSVDRSGDGVDALSLDPSLDPSLDAVADTEGEPGSSVATSGSTARSTSDTGSARTTPTSKGSSVQRTETSTRTQTNPGPITASPPGDETSVGNRGDKNIRDEFKPDPVTTTSTEPPTDSTPPTSAEPDPTDPSSP